MTSGEPIADAIAELMLRAPAGFAISLHMRQMLPSLTLSTYPEAWVDHYSLEGLAIADPVVRWGCYDTGAVRWSQLLEDDAYGVLEQARPYGMSYGLAVSLGPEDDRSLGGFARPDREFAVPELEEIAALVATLHERTAGLDAFGPAAMTMIRNMGATLQFPTPRG